MLVPEFHRTASRKRRWVSAKIISCGLLVSGTVFAAMDQNHAASTDSPSPQLGHSAVYYGITDPVQQVASLRAALEGQGLDNPSPAPSLLAASTLLLMNMFAGGGGAPLDVVQPRSDMASYFAAKTTAASEAEPCRSATADEFFVTREAAPVSSDPADQALGSKPEPHCADPR